MKARWILSLLVTLVAARAEAISTAPGYPAHSIPTPGTVQGGVVRRGGPILVGQGSFGAGREPIIRLDGGGPPPIATGSNSPGGLALDAAGPPSRAHTRGRPRG